MHITQNESGADILHTNEIDNAQHIENPLHYMCRLMEDLKIPMREAQAQAQIYENNLRQARA